jgi:putative ABC transport system permease protein
MRRVTLRGLQGHLVRLLLTAAAVMLGVSFVTGTFVLRDSFDRALGGLVTGSTAGLDVSVRGAEVAGGDGTRARVPLNLVDTLSAVPGVARVSPDLQGVAIIAGSDGIAVRNSGAPGLGFAFSDDDPAFKLVAGRGPTNPGEVVVETVTLDKAGLEVGDHTRAVIGGETRSVTVTGEVEFGVLFGATAVLVDQATALRDFAPDGTVASITIGADPGVSQLALRTSVADVLPGATEAVTGAAVNAENETAVQQGLGFATTFLLLFAGVALFVGAFIIANTFTMLIGQRARELALLRALGASRNQVLGSVMGEAAVVGVVGSVLGMGLGILIAQGAKIAIRGLLGVDIGTSLPVTSSTLLISLAVGTLVTMASAILPARRAARTAPVAAMRGDTPIAQRGLRRRGTAGAVLLVVGASLLGFSVARDNVPWVLAGIGSFVAVIGMLVGAPLYTRPVVRVVAWPFVVVSGVVARLARQNALRVPRRTAATASALMIGLALVAGISVLAQSVKASVTEGVSNELTSDFVLSGGVSTVPPTVAEEARGLPQVGSVAAVSLVPVRIGDFSTSAAAVEAGPVSDNFTIPMADGRLDSLEGDRVLVDRTTATDNGWKVGDVLTATVGTLGEHDLVVGGVYEDSQAFGSHLIVDRGLYEAAVPLGLRADLQVFVSAAAGADQAELHDALVGIVRPYLVVSVQNASEFASAEGSAIDNLLNLLYVLLLFSVVIAVLGIVNTLALSVLERTREIGLLRAIGLQRRQLGAMITIEAIATAVFGAVLGTLLGLGLGVALQRGLQSQGLNALGIPWGLIGLMLVASVLVGVLAAVAPSIRATRLTILGAINRV